MDEPLGALDKKLRSEMQIEIKRLHEDLGLTVVYVTHDQEEALSMSDRIAVMRDGLIEQLDTPTNIYTRPRTPFVATFVGDTTLIAGQLAVRATERPSVLARNGVLIPIAHRPELRDGAEVVLALRAERVTVSGQATAAGGDDEATIEGLVESAIYVGGAWRFELSLADGQRLRGMCMENGKPVPSRGDQVVARWSIEDAQVLTDG